MSLGLSVGGGEPLSGSHGDKSEIGRGLLKVQFEFELKG